MKTLTIEVKYVLEVPEELSIERVHKSTGEVDILYDGQRIKPGA